ncbi:MAG: manganese efflux pump MntP family protein [Clostridiales bacterium]|jgi:putative Mn2+ efflux pump MntP|nr:manganese efflux pump MntP family protein [Clostridiales bacterium]
MGLFELIILAGALSMDAFAVAICAGLAMPKVTLKKAAVVGLYFGVFQAAMPLIGFFVATWFADSINAYAHWIAFALLAFLGGRMILESLEKEEDEKQPAAEPTLKPSEMLPLALATSIDALAAGASFAVLKVDFGPAVSLIGVITFVFSMIGVKIGNAFGVKFKAKAEFAGGVILILIGLKIWVERMWFS